MHNTNRRGEREHPCLMPRVTGNGGSAARSRTVERTRPCRGVLSLLRSLGEAKGLEDPKQVLVFHSVKGFRLIERNEASCEAGS